MTIVRARADTLHRLDSLRRGMLPAGDRIDAARQALLPGDSSPTL
jgi:hypothetical protein